MDGVLVGIFGSGGELDAAHMAARAGVVFILVLVMVRISGRRSFALRTPLDLVVTILLGAVAARGVVGASPFGPTMLACFVLAALHRAVAWLAAVSPALSHALNGPRRRIWHDDRIDVAEMRRALLTHEDLMEACRRAGECDLLPFAEAWLERSGRISLVRKRPVATSDGKADLRQ